MSQTPPEETPLESDSILESTKATLGIPPGHTAFDAMVTTYINAVLSTLEQLGVGPEGGLYVTSKAQVWEELIGTDARLNAVKAYMHLRVRLLFDPPQIGFVLSAMQDQIKELESRINMIVDDHVDPRVVVRTIDEFGDAVVYVVAGAIEYDTVLDGGDA